MLKPAVLISPWEKNKSHPPPPAHLCRASPAQTRERFMTSPPRIPAGCVHPRPPITQALSTTKTTVLVATAGGQSVMQHVAGAGSMPGECRGDPARRGACRVLLPLERGLWRPAAPPKSPSCSQGCSIPVALLGPLLAPFLGDGQAADPRRQGRAASPGNRWGGRCCGGAARQQGDTQVCGQPPHLGAPAQGCQAAGDSSVPWLWQEVPFVPAPAFA